MMLVGPCCTLALVTITALDEEMVRAALMVVCIVWLGFVAAGISEALRIRELLPPACVHDVLGALPCSITIPQFVGVGLFSCVAGLSGACASGIAACMHTAPRARLSVLWNTLGYSFLPVSLSYLVATVLELVALESSGLGSGPDSTQAERDTARNVRHANAVILVFVVEGLLVAAFALCPRKRLHVQQYLMSQGEQVVAASAIASLLGRMDPDKAKAVAARRFRYVTLDQISREELADATPDQRLFARSKPAKLGEVDAFLSHSWRDDPTAKWVAIQGWRHRFKEVHRREPRVWIDKCCIDQTDIATNLMCLPIFLAGCNQLLALHGKSYLTRLWCVIELFVFLEMGGTPRQIDLRPLVGVDDILVHPMMAELSSARAGGQDVDCHALDRVGEARKAEWIESLRLLDARAATAFLPEDRDRLLATIDAGFGGFDAFNCALRKILVQVAEEVDVNSVWSDIFRFAGLGDGEWNGLGDWAMRFQPNRDGPECARKQAVARVIMKKRHSGQSSQGQGEARLSSPDGGTRSSGQSVTPTGTAAAGAPVTSPGSPELT
mmetsp:Transcript_5434/g.16185  ORF Transcript_5434/g.16185 Transcript_5434/m.16185 type:complete len:554 (-) Transcript_5434:293-1954(-)